MKRSRIDLRARLLAHIEFRPAPKVRGGLATGGYVCWASTGAPAYGTTTMTPGSDESIEAADRMAEEIALKIEELERLGCRVLLPGEGFDR